MIPYILAQTASIAASILGISFIIIFHEFGHYIFCKIFNVYTPTFSIGIGKILYSKKIGDTNFCISAGPIGGYVEVASEHGLNGSKGFNEIPYYQKVLIMLGGIFCNFILAYFILVGLFFSGMPENIASTYEPCTTKIAHIAQNSLNSGQLKPSDVLVAINDQNINNDLKIARKIIANIYEQNSQVSAIISRNDQTINLMLNIRGKETQPTISRQLDVSFELKPTLNIAQSIQEAYKAVIFYTQSIIAGLYNMIHQRSTQGFVGPLMAVAASSKSAQKGCAYLLFFLAIISINLGFMNLLPLPIFDGGQFVIFSIEAILNRQFSERIRNIIGISSWALAIGLLILFTIRDLHSLILG